MNNIFDYIKWIWGIDYALPDTDSVLYRYLQFNKTAVISQGDNMFYGVIKEAGVIGPVFTAPPDREGVTEILRSLNAKVSEYKMLGELLMSAPVMSINELLKVVCLAHFSLHGEVIKPEELLPDYTEQTVAHSSVAPGRNYQLEQMLLPLIRRGDTESLVQLLSNAQFKTAFSLGGTNLQSLKKTAIAFITLASREAINAGAEVEAALAKSDEYLIMLDSVHSADALFSLMFRAAVAFTRLSGSESDKNLSLHTLKAVKFINRNIDKKIKLCDLAEHTGVTPNYLSCVFKKEMGMTVAEYVKAQKLSEAKRLLTETDYSLSEITLHLGYSSQSYFQNQFKSEFGITPTQYKTAD